MISSRKRKMSSTEEELDETKDGVDPAAGPTKIIKGEDTKDEDDETSLKQSNDVTETETTPLFIISRVSEVQMEESTGGGGGGVQQLGLNNSHATENPSNNSSRNGPKNVSIISHLKETDAQDDGHEDEGKSTLLASMEEYRENKSEVATTLQQDQGINEPESNPTVVDVPTPTKQKSKTKESKNPEQTKATEQAIHAEGGSNRRNNPSSLKSDGITSPSPKSSGQQHNPTPTHADDMLEENEQLDPIHVGRVIGKGGEMIRDLQARSACRIDVDQNVAPGQPRIITYRGTRKTVDFAKNLVQILCSDAIKMGEMDLPLGEAKQKVVSVPASSIGRIIGRGGEMIRELQTRSHAKIQIDHSNTHPDPNVKLITVTGSDASVVKAEEMIVFIVEKSTVDAMTALNMFADEKYMRGAAGPYGPVSSYPHHMMMHPIPGRAPTGVPMGSMSRGAAGSRGHEYHHPGVPVDNRGGGAGVYPPPPYGGDGYGAPNPMPIPSMPAQPIHGIGIEREIFPCSKLCMGRIIGRKGVTVNDIQKRSGCDIQINQDVPQGSDCEITIQGTRPGIDSAKRMLIDIIQMGSNHPYAGGEGAASVVSQQGMIQQQPTGMYAPPTGGVAYMQPQYMPQPSYPYPMYAPMQYPQYPGYVGVTPMVNTNPPVTWKSAFAPDGQPYYYNDRGETTWEKPAGFL